MTKRSALMALSGLVAMIASTGCLVDNPDYLEVNSWVVANDGVSQVVNLRLDYYDWFVRYDDYTQMRIPFSGYSGGSRITTGYSDPLMSPGIGNLAFGSYNLGLHSGDETISCYETCTEKDFDGYCVEWTSDCYDSTLTMDVANIVATSAEISYRVGSSFITTGSQSDTQFLVADFNGPIDSTTWHQSEIFVTPFSAAAAKVVDGKKTVDASTYALPIAASAPKKPVRRLKAADVQNDPAKVAILAKARTHLRKKAE